MSPVALIGPALAGLLAVHLAALWTASAVLARRIEAAHPPLGRFVATEGGRIHLYDLAPRAAVPECRLGEEDAPVPGDRSGAGARPPILLLHGATSNARDMLLALGDLARDQRVLIPDRPGHGWSDRPGGRRDADPAAQARRMVDMLDRLGVGRVVVVGFSWSGALATALALDHPERVAGLVLLAGVTHPWRGGIAWPYRLAAIPVLGPGLARLLVTPIGAIGFGRSVIDSFRPQAPPAAYAEASAAALILEPRRFCRNAQDLAALLARVRVQAPRLSGIVVPTAVLAGTADTTVSPDLHARAAAAAIPGARLTLLEGVGHMPHHAAPAVVLAEIRRVAEQVSGGGSL